MIAIVLIICFLFRYLRFDSTKEAAILLLAGEEGEALAFLPAKLCCIYIQLLFC